MICQLNIIEVSLSAKQSTSSAVSFTLKMIFCQVTKKVCQVSFNPSDEKPLSAYTDEELLDFLGVKSTLEDVFRNYNMTDEEKREFLLEKAEEKNQKYI